MLSALNIVALVVPLVFVAALFLIRGLMRRAGSARVQPGEAVSVPAPSESVA
jgi:hypothetical protein